MAKSYGYGVIWKVVFVAVCLAVIGFAGCSGAGDSAGVDCAVGEWPIGNEPAVEQTGRVASELLEFDFASRLVLEDCLAYAALHNPGLEAAFDRWRAALERVPQVGALPDPQFSYTYFITEVETRVGPQRQRFMLSQMFPWFGKLELRTDAAVAAAKAARQEYEQEKLKLFNRVKQVFYQYYYLGRATELTRENLMLLGSLEAIARTKYQSGTLDQTAVIRFQMDIGKLEDRLRSLEEMRRPMVAKFNAALNHPLDGELAWPGELGQLAVNLDEQAVMAELRENNPKLARMQAQIEKARYEVDLAGKDFYPDIGLGVMFIDTREAVMPVNDSGRDPLAVTASVNLPLNRGKYTAGENEAKLRHRSALKQRADLENELLADLQLAVFEYQDAQRRVDLYQNILIPKAKQSLSVTQQAFAAGRAQYLDMIDAVRTVLEFELAYEKARSERGGKLAEIEMLVGKDKQLER